MSAIISFDKWTHCGADFLQTLQFMFLIPVLQKALWGTSILCCGKYFKQFFLLSFLNHTGAKFQKHGRNKRSVSQTQVLIRNYFYNKSVQAHVLSPGSFYHSRLRSTVSHLHNRNQAAAVWCRDMHTCVTLAYFWGPAWAQRSCCPTQRMQCCSLHV